MQLKRLRPPIWHAPCPEPWARRPEPNATSRYQSDITAHFGKNNFKAELSGAAASHRKLCLVHESEPLRGAVFPVFFDHSGRSS